MNFWSTRHPPMSMTHKLAVELGGGTVVTILGFFSRGERAEMLIVSINHNLGDIPVQSAMIKDALDSQSRSPVSPSIEAVLLICGWPQIIPAIIEIVPVFVVDLIRRIVPRHPLPYNPMRQIEALFNYDSRVTVVVVDGWDARISAIPTTPDPITGKVRSRTYFPSKATAFRLNNRSTRANILVVGE